MKVIVDADACPRAVLKIIKRLRSEYAYRLITVASFNHNITGPEHIVVGDECQAADMAIINRTVEDDIVVTADWGLASLALGKSAKAISPSGVIYTNKKIDLMLEERHLKEKIRQSGGRTKGPSARKEKEDEKFLESFKKLLHN